MRRDERLGDRMPLDREAELLEEARGDLGMTGAIARRIVRGRRDQRRKEPGLRLAGIRQV